MSKVGLILTTDRVHQTMIQPNISLLEYIKFRGGAFGNPIFHFFELLMDK